MVASQSGRYFGFVVGGSLPVALAADWLVSTWDQNLGFLVLGPSAVVMENIAGEWTKELLGIPADASFAFVTGCQMAHVTCLACCAPARPRVARLGPAGRRPRRITADHGPRGRQAALNGRPSTPVPGNRPRADPRSGRAPTAGWTPARSAQHCRPGRSDDRLRPGRRGEHRCLRRPRRDRGRRRGSGAWHGGRRLRALGCRIAGASTLVTGHERADSWATDAHKWLNVPYDCGIAFTRHPDAHRDAMTAQAAYYVRDPDAIREPVDWTPDHSRRARAVPVYAALRQLGRSGWPTSSSARAATRGGSLQAWRTAGLRSAERGRPQPGALPLRGRRDDRAALARVQESGEAWMSGTSWDGREAIRLSVSNWRTTDSDIDRTVAAFAAAVG